MKQNKSYKFRIYPTKEQEKFLANQFGGVRFVYNFFLNRRKEEYLVNKKSFSYYKDAKYLTELKNKNGYEWLYEISNICLQQSLRHLEIAYTRFFAKKSKFPKFKKRSNNQSIKYVPAFNLEENKLWIPKLKTGIKIKQDRELPFKPSSCVVSSTPSGKYYASFCCEEEIKSLQKSEKSVGIDLGIKDLLITSDGTIFKNEKLNKKFEKKLKFKQRKLSKKKKGSNNRNKARKELAKLHERIVFKRIDNLHKISRKLINENQVIVAEDLNVAGMMKNHKLAGSIQNVSWFELIRQIQYKSEWYGRTFIQIDRWFPSSKMCGGCHYVMDKLPLNIREWTCPVCGIVHDRDINAAKNILNKGLEDLKQTTKSGSGIESDLKQKLGEALLPAFKPVKAKKQSKSMKRDISELNLK